MEWAQEYLLKNSPLRKSTITEIKEEEIDEDMIYEDSSGPMDESTIVPNSYDPDYGPGIREDF